VIDSISQNILFNTLDFNTFSAFKKYHCKIEGHMIFNKVISSIKDNVNKIPTYKLKDLHNVFSIDLNSKDLSCNFRIKANLKIKDDDTGLMGLCYYLYVAFFSLLIIRSGFKLIFESIQNRETNKKTSIWIVCFASLLDFFFIFDFFVTGRLVIVIV
jgi:hypothetical protein